MSPQLSPSGHLLFWRQEALWAVPFDQERLEIQGTPVPVLQGWRPCSTVSRATWSGTTARDFRLSNDEQTKPTFFAETSRRALLYATPDFSGGETAKAYATASETWSGTGILKRFVTAPPAAPG